MFYIYLTLGAFLSYLDCSQLNYAFSPNGKWLTVSISPIQIPEDSRFTVLGSSRSPPQSVPIIFRLYPGLLLKHHVLVFPVTISNVKHARTHIHVHIYMWVIHRSTNQLPVYLTVKMCLNEQSS